MPGSPGTAPAPELPPGPRLALVVATATYSDPGLQQLRAPARDAADLTRVLADPEVGAFTVTSVADAPAQDIRLAVDDFLADRGTQDLLLVYLSCHGLLDQYRRLYFAARDTRKDRLAATGVEASWVLDQLEHCRARRQVLVLDSCFSGAFAQGAKGDAEVRLQDRFAGHGRGRIVLTASNATEYSFEGDLAGPAEVAGSVFTAALVAGMRSGAADADGDGYISVDDAYAYAFEQVKASGAAQTPQRWLFGAEGSIVLARSPAGRVVTPAPLPESLRTALESPHPSVRAGAVEELGAWIASDDPARILTARAELARIADGDIPPVAELARRYVAAERTSSVPPTVAHYQPASQPTSRPQPLSVAPARAAEPPVVISARRGRVLPGHERATLAVVFSPDGRLLATGGAGNTIRLWDAATGEQQREMFGASAVDALAFSKSGRWLAACARKAVLLWDLANGQLIRSLEGLEDGMHAIAFAGDGEVRAVSSNSPLLRRWRTDTGLPLQPVKLTPWWEPHNSVLLDTSASRQSAYVAEHKTNVSIVFSRDGSMLAVGGGERVRLWAADRRWRRMVIKSKAPILAVTFGADPGKLATCDSHDNFRIWDMPLSGPETTFRGNHGSVTRCPLSLHGNVLAAGGYQGIQLWNTVTGGHLGNLQSEIDHATEARPKIAQAARARAVATVAVQHACLAFSPDGRLLAVSEAIHEGVTSNWSSRVQLWHLDIVKQRSDQ